MTPRTLKQFAVNLGAVYLTRQSASRFLRGAGLAAVMAAALFMGVQSADAGAIRSNAGFAGNTLAPNDDGSTGLVGLGFTANFFGVSSTQAFVNNNGNITFDSTLSTFTPFDLTSTGQQIIAPFFGDVDTSRAGSPVQYGTDTVGGHNAFGVNWINVDYFSSSTSHTNRNSFQLVLIDRSDVAAGDFDIEFNIDQIQWEAGTASGSDSNGLGGSSARSGFSNGTGVAGTFFELPGSAVNGAFLDTGPAGTALILNELNSAGSFDSNGQVVLGRYLFQARNGDVVVVGDGNGTPPPPPPPPPPNGIPEPASLAIFGLGLLGLGVVRRRRRSS